MDEIIARGSGLKLWRIVKRPWKPVTAEIGPELFPQLKRMILLQMIDVAWKEHLYDLDQLKKGISLRAYAQKDPLIEFQHEAFESFYSDDVPHSRANGGVLVQGSYRAASGTRRLERQCRLRQNPCLPVRRRKSLNLQDRPLNRSLPSPNPCLLPAGCLATAEKVPSSSGKLR